MRKLFWIIMVDPKHNQKGPQKQETDEDLTREEERELDDRIRGWSDARKASPTTAQMSSKSGKGKGRELLLEPSEGTSPVKLASASGTIRESICAVLSCQVCGSSLQQP